jgi:hypothetical protein
MAVHENLSGLFIMYQISFATSSLRELKALYSSLVIYLQSLEKSSQTCVSAFSVSASLSLLIK